MDISPDPIMAPTRSPLQQRAEGMIIRHLTYSQPNEREEGFLVMELAPQDPRSMDAPVTIRIRPTPGSRSMMAGLQFDLI